MNKFCPYYRGGGLIPEREVKTGKEKGKEGRELMGRELKFHN